MNSFWGCHDLAKTLGRSSPNEEIGTCSMGNVVSDFRISSRRIFALVKSAMSLPSFADLESPCLQSMVWFRDDFLAEAMQIAIEALPVLILTSPLATGCFRPLHSTKARSLLEIHPTSTSMCHVAELFGYHPMAILGRETPWATPARNTFPHWQIIPGPFSSFHSNSAISLRVTPSVVVLRGEATKLIWSHNKGISGRLEDVVSEILKIRTQIVPGDVILICRWNEEDELWREKTDTFALCAEELRLNFSASWKYVRLELPRLHPETNLSRGNEPLWEEFPVDWLDSVESPSALPRISRLSREVWDQSLWSERLTTKKSRSTSPSSVK